MQKQLTTIKKNQVVAGGMVEIMVGIVKQEKDILVGHVTKNPSQNFCQQKNKKNTI